MLYTGITTDIERRFSEHSGKDEKGAKYTKSHEVLKVEAVWQSDNRSEASKLEFALKKLTKQQKEELIINTDKFNIYLSKKIECNLYKRYK
jgi:putative endonuclease